MAKQADPQAKATVTNGWIVGICAIIAAVIAGFFALRSSEIQKAAEAVSATATASTIQIRTAIVTVPAVEVTREVEKIVEITKEVTREVEKIVEVTSTPVPQAAVDSPSTATTSVKEFVKEVGDYSISIDEVIRKDEEVVVSFILFRRQDATNELICAGAPCKAYDDDGNTYLMSGVEAGGKSSDLPNLGVRIPGGNTPFRVKVAFKLVPTTLTQLRAIEMTTTFTDAPIAFTNVPIPYKAK